MNFPRRNIADEFANPVTLTITSSNASSLIKKKKKIQYIYKIHQHIIFIQIFHSSFFTTGFKTTYFSRFMFYFHRYLHNSHMSEDE